MTAKLNYPFIPLPRLVWDTFRDGRFANDHLLILSALYARMNFDSRKVRVTLDALEADIHWDGTRDWMSRRLGQLRKSGWVDYRAPRRSGAAYLITMNQYPWSEEPPNADEAGHPLTPEVASVVNAAIAASPEPNESELAPAFKAETSPNGLDESPNLPAVPNGSAEPELVVALDDSVRTSQNVQNKTNPSSEDVKDHESSFDSKPPAYHEALPSEIKWQVEQGTLFDLDPPSGHRTGAYRTDGDGG